MEQPLLSLFGKYSEGIGLPRKVTWAIGALFALCVLIRLARFNVETTEDDPHEGFEGLPSPAAAGTIAAFVIAMPELNAYITETTSETGKQIAEQLLKGSQIFGAALTLTLAYLMGSRFLDPHVCQQVSTRASCASSNWTGIICPDWCLAAALARSANRLLLLRFCITNQNTFPAMETERRS